MQGHGLQGAFAGLQARLDHAVFHLEMQAARVLAGCLQAQLTLFDQGHGHTRQAQVIGSGAAQQPAANDQDIRPGGQGARGTGR